jgi:hypothetical protein
MSLALPPFLARLMPIYNAVFIDKRQERWLVLMLLLLLSSCNPARAARQAVLVLRPELTAKAVFGPGTPFAPLLRRAAVGVLNVAVRGPREPASAYLTLGAGERLPAGPLARPACLSEEIVEGDPAAVVYARRMGPLPVRTPDSLPRIVDTDWAAFLNVPEPDYAPGERRAAGGLGQALLPRGGVAWLGVGEAARTRLGALVALDAAGTVRWGDTIGRSGDRAFWRSGPERDSPERLNARSPERPIAQGVSALLRRSPLVVLDLPSDFATGPLAGLLVELARDPCSDVLLVSPYPPPGAGGAWDRLPPILGLGPDFQPGMLTSATTHTSGLVANIDIAPTLLAALGAPRPRTMSGRVIHSEMAADHRQGTGAAAVVLRFARSAALSGRAIVPIGVTIEAGAVMVLALVVAALRGGSGSSPWIARLASAAMLMVAAVPLGLLLGPVTAPRTVLGLGLAVAGWAAAAVLAAVLGSQLQGHNHAFWILDFGFWIAGQGRNRSGDRALVGPPQNPKSKIQNPKPLPWLAGLTVVIVASDLLMGGRLIARSPLSGFLVSGIRFYGVGNEYLGVMVGMGIVAPLAFEAHLPRYRWAQAALFLGLLLLIGSPRYGANFGGALAGAAGFGATLALAIWPQRPLRALLLAGGALLLAGAGALVWDALRPAAARTHIGDFAQAVWTGGWPAAAPVLRRKAAMDLRILTSGFAVVPLAAVLPLVGLWYRGAGRWVSTLLAGRPELRAVVGGALAGAWTGLFFKDSGVTPWMYIMGAMLAVLLDEQLRERAK